MQPVAWQMIKFYKTTPLVLNCLMMGYYVLFSIFCLPSNYILNKYGSRASVIIGVVLMTAGAVIKCFINYSFGFCILGAVIAGSGLAFIWNAPA